MDYSIFYKEELPINKKWDYEADVFITAYNTSDRCIELCKRMQSKETISIILPEYGYRDNEIPKNTNRIEYYQLFDQSEKLIVDNIFQKYKKNLNRKKLCIDITGFMRPQFMYIMKYLSTMKIKKFDVLYAEPVEYTKKENTTFSDGKISDVRQVNGYEGDHIIGNTKEILVIGSGYDYKLIQNVCDRKKNADVIQIYGFPSLKADMIQQNILAANMAYYEMQDGSVSQEAHFWTRPNVYYAPANDPFETANIISKIVNKAKQINNRLNIYLSPISSKPQTLGFAIYYLWECINKPVSILYPITTKYQRETTVGISRVWKYSVELP